MESKDLEEYVAGAKWYKESSRSKKKIIAYGYYGGVLKKLILNLKYHKSFIAGEGFSWFSMPDN